jgi:hypothetical protein
MFGVMKGCTHVLDLEEVSYPLKASRKQECSSLRPRVIG